MFALIFRRYAPFAKFGFGFEGDHRKGPSVSMNATARTIGSVPFDRGQIGFVGGSSSGTQYVGGPDWLRKLAGNPKSHVSSSISGKAVTANTISFTASTAGANPMLKLIAPDIDTFIDFGVEWIGTGLRFHGRVRGDDFPNAEVFVLDSDGAGCLLFDGRTTGGQDTGPITRLAGAHQSRVLGSFNCAMPLSRSGTFLHARTSCTVMKMEMSSNGRWGPGTGQFNGAGASAKW